MTLDDLMAVWKSQDAAPLHGVNETLLRLALRNDEMKVQARRRRLRWMVYLMSASVVAFYATLVVRFFDKLWLSGWALAYLLIIGGVFVLLVPLTHLRHRAQARREQSFGESLRDQLRRRIAQLDFQLESSRRTIRIASAIGTLAVFGGLMFIYLSGKWATAWAAGHVGIFALTFIVSAIALAISRRMVRSWEQRDMLPKRRRLEALLKDLDGQQ
jgi:hypothetical protein